MKTSTSLTDDMAPAS